MAQTINGRLHGNPAAPLSPAELAAVAAVLLERKHKALASLTAAYSALHADDINGRPSSKEHRAALAFAEDQFVIAHRAHAEIIS